MKLCHGNQLSHLSHFGQHNPEICKYDCDDCFYSGVKSPFWFSVLSFTETMFLNAFFCMFQLLSLLPNACFPSPSSE
jgi:hypothetical protein